MKELYILLKQNKYKLAKQQYLTIKGQLKKGDIEGARKGLFTCMYKNKEKVWKD